MSVREIYAATNDLNALNFIGEGVAGNYFCPYIHFIFLEMKLKDFGVRGN